MTRPEHAWAAYQYDLSAAKLGYYCDLGLSHTDDKGRRLFTLSGLLAERDTRGQPSTRRYRTDFANIPFEAAA